MNNAGSKSSVGKTSNAERLRRADAAVRAFAELNQVLEETIIARNGLHASLCAVLAQKGGEVTITPGTMKQVAENAMGFQIVSGDNGEFTLRLVEEAPNQDQVADPLNLEDIEAKAAIAAERMVTLD